MKTYGKVERRALHIFNFGTRWRWVVSFTHWLLWKRGNRPRYHFDRSLGGPQSRSRRGDEEEKSLPCSGWKLTHGRPACRLVTKLTELSLFKGSLLCTNICKFLWRLLLYISNYCPLRNLIHTDWVIFISYLLTYLLTYLPTHSMVQDINWKADYHSACQKISCLLTEP
jgi:hypothetical protein